MASPQGVGACRAVCIWFTLQTLAPQGCCALPRATARRPEGELRCVLAVIRHGDRTPKQKMKMKVTQEPLLALLHKYLDSKGKQAKLKVGVSCLARRPPHGAQHRAPAELAR
jgi:hypothetical protein